MKALLINPKIFFPLSSLISLTIIIISMQSMVRSAHGSYWLAIDRVQTVDFNMLAATSIGTVGEIIRSNNHEKAMEFVASNYCLFRIQIAKCPDEKCTELVLLADNATQDAVRCDSLNGNDTSVLSVPVFENSTHPATVSFAHAYAKHPQTQEANQVPIGYLRLFRGNVVPFELDYTEFIKRWLRGEANASRHDIYKTSAWVSILLGMLAFFVLFVYRLFYISQLKRMAITNKLISAIDRKITR